MQFLPAFVAPGAHRAARPARAARACCRALYVGEAAIFAPAGAAGDVVLARPRARARAARRRAHAHRPRAHARRRQRASCSPPACCGRATGCSTSASRSRASAAPRWAACSSTPSAPRRRSRSTPPPSPSSPPSSATCRHLPAAHAERQPFLERVRAGLSHVRTDRLARVLVGGEALALVFFTLIVPIEVVYARETLQTDEAGYGILLSSWGAGVVLGSFVFLGVRRRSSMRCSSSLDAGHRRRLPRHVRRARAVAGVRVLRRSAASATASSGCRS